MTLILATTEVGSSGFTFSGTRLAKVFKAGSKYNSDR